MTGLVNPIDADVWPKLGRGGFYRNQHGQAVVSHPDGGKRTLTYKGASDWWPFVDPYNGDPIYGERGTHIHTLCDTVDNCEELSAEFIAAGVALGISEALQAHIAASWIVFSESHRIAVHAIEQTFVNDRHRCASNVDRIFTMGSSPWSGGDIKTAGNVTKKVYAAQLAMIPGSQQYDPATRERTDWAQPIDSSAGYIFWFPLNEAIKADGPNGWPDWSLVRVDLAEIGATCDTLSAIRDAGTPDGCFEIIEADSVDEDARREKLRARYAQLDNTAQAAFLALAVPADADNDTLEAALDKVDPFTQPSTPLGGRFVAPEAVKPPTLTATTDEGPTVAAGVAKAIQGRYVSMAAAQTAWVNAIATQAHQAGASLSMRDNPTTRRAEVINALVVYALEFVVPGATAENEADADDMLRAALAVVVGEDTAWSAAFSLGQIVATIDAEAAVTFGHVVQMLTTGLAPLSFTDDGRPQISTQNNAA